MVKVVLHLGILIAPTGKVKSVQQQQQESTIVELPG